MTTKINRRSLFGLLLGVFIPVEAKQKFIWHPTLGKLTPEQIKMVAIHEEGHRRFREKSLVAQYFRCKICPISMPTPKSWNRAVDLLVNDYLSKVVQG